MRKVQVLTNARLTDTKLVLQRPSFGWQKQRQKARHRSHKEFLSAGIIRQLDVLSSPCWDNGQ